MASKDIALYCYQLVATEFAAMHNPHFRGPNFKWENFASRVSAMAANRLTINMQIPDDKLEESKTVARNYAFEIATNLVNVMQETSH